jgi:FAD/FMN-containing dehydrogenase
MRYSNKCSIPFFAQSGGHGFTSTIANVKNGNPINLRALNSTTISPGGEYAISGGGVKGKEVIDMLWPFGKQTVTGVCECVGLTAVALGGGHGALQGYYGLASDQLLSVRLVLANGSAITVSETERSDLFWALRGADHNFGIVTSLSYRIHDIDMANGKDIWSYELFIYAATPENVRAVYTQASKMVDDLQEGIF